MPRDQEISTSSTTLPQIIILTEKVEMQVDRRIAPFTRINDFQLFIARTLTKVVLHKI